VVGINFKAVNVNLIFSDDVKSTNKLNKCSKQHKIYKKILTFLSYYFILLRSVIWTVSIVLMLFKPQRFKGWFFPRHHVKPTLLGPADQASLYW
jgi:hypothetical protein